MSSISFSASRASRRGSAGPSGRAPNALSQGEMSVLTPEPLQITEPFRGRNDTRRNLVGLSRDDLKTVMADAGLEPFRARQVWQWIYWHGVTDFGRMTNIAKKTQGRLSELFVIERPQIVTEQRS